MPSDIWTPMFTNNHSLCNKSLRARSKVARVVGNARLVPRYVVTSTYGNQERKIQKIFSVFQKIRARLMNNFITTTFGKSLFLTQYQFWRLCNQKQIIVYTQLSM